MTIAGDHRDRAGGGTSARPSKADRHVDQLTDIGADQPRALLEEPHPAIATARALAAMPPTD